MRARFNRLGLPTGRRVEVRADPSIRVMLRSGLIEEADDLVMADLLDGVVMDDRSRVRRLQDALVMHVLDTTNASELDGLADADFATLIEYAVSALTPEIVEDDAEVDDEEVLGVTDALVETSLEDELDAARRETLPEVKVPASAEVLEKMEAEA